MLCQVNKHEQKYDTQEKTYPGLYSALGVYGLWAGGGSYLSSVVGGLHWATRL